MSLLKSSLLNGEFSASGRLTVPISCDFADNAVAGESLIFDAGRCPGFRDGGVGDRVRSDNKIVLHTQRKPKGPGGGRGVRVSTHTLLGL